MTSASIDDVEHTVLSALAGLWRGSPVATVVILLVGTYILKRTLVVVSALWVSESMHSLIAESPLICAEDLAWIPYSYLHLPLRAIHLCILPATEEPVEPFHQRVMAGLEHMCVNAAFL